MTLAALGAVGALALTTADLAGPAPQQPAVAAGLVTFPDCNAVRDWYRPILREQAGRWGPGPSWPGGPTSGVPDRLYAARAEAAAGSGGTVGSAVGPGATGTNVQEDGVDEPDTVKAAGGRLVTVVRGTLMVYDVTGSTPRLLGTLRLPATSGRDAHSSEGPSLPGRTSDVLLAGTRVVVLQSSAYSVPVPVEPRRPAGGRPALEHQQFLVPVPTTTTHLVEIADPARPVLVGSEEVEGRLVSAREVRGVVRLVTSSWPAPRPSDRSDGIDALTGEQMLPHLITRTANGAVAQRRPAMACTELAHPEAAAGAGLISVRTVDPAGVRPGGPITRHVTGVAADGDLAYTAADRLYVATTVGGWARTAAAPAATTVRTSVHGFDIAGPDSRYLVSGSVDGQVLNRWAFSARDGLLRIATTRWPARAVRDGGTDSAVTVLREDGRALVRVGDVTGLGKGEEIKSVRWFDDVALVVTFRQTDPLYVVDLSRPERPVVRGELKVPGFSSYLHPVDADRILGVGSAATDTGQVTGAQLSTFDLSDPNSPRRLHVVTEPRAWTRVADDSRMFSYLPSRRIAVLPFGTPDGRQQLRAFRVEPNGALSAAGSYPLVRWGYQNGGRAIPVDSDRLAVVVDDGTRSTLTLLTVDGLRTTGSTRIS